MDTANKTLAQLTTEHKKFKFHRTVLILCELYFAYTYVIDFPKGSPSYRIVMGGILLAIAFLAFYAHRKMASLQEKILNEVKNQND